MKDISRRDDEGFNKVSENDMRRAFGARHIKVIPYILKYILKLITFLELDGYTDGNFFVTNGRHRIKVARDLDWAAVPVKCVRAH